MSAPAGSTVGSNPATGSKMLLTDYCLWQEPETGVRIYLNFATVDRLQLEVLRGGKGFPAGEAEVGGILMGRNEMDDQGMITLIEDFAPVPCSYLNGPRYCFSDQEVVNFQAALAQCSSNTSDLSVLGFYRSHNRDDLYLSSDDLAIIHRFFREEDKIFLVVKTLPSRACTAGFFFWEDGHIQTEFTYLEVPLSPVKSFSNDELARTVTRTTKDVLTTVTRSLPSQTFQSLELPESPPRGSSVWLKRGLAVALVATVVTLAAFSYWRTARSPDQQISTPVVATLGLQVGRKADSLAVMWDRNSPEIAGAKRGALSIRDGAEQKMLQLDESQLRSGGVSYKPSGDDIQFRLEVYRERKPSSVESIHVLIPSVGVLTNEAGIPGPLLKEKGPAAKGSSPQINSKAMLTARKQEQVQPTPLLSSSVSSPRPFRFVAPPSSKSLGNSAPAGNDIQFDQPPSIPVETNSSELILASATVRPEAPPPPINRVQPAVAQRPIAPAESPPTQATPVSSGNAGSAPQPVVSSFVGPHLIRQVNPSMPLDMRLKITSDVQIDVMVTIDANGKVTDATIVSKQGGVAQFISGHVLQAARLFQFQPAQDNHRNVESKMILTFRFSSGQGSVKSTK